MNLHPKLKAKLKQLETLDKKQAEISKAIDNIYKVSPVGQAPPEFHRKCDQLCDIATKKAPIWNYIRSFVIPGSGGETIWQKALRLPNLGYVFKSYGKESGTCITAKVIKEQILEII